MKLTQVLQSLKSLSIPIIHDVGLLLKILLNAKCAVIKRALWMILHASLAMLIPRKQR